MPILTELPVEILPLTLAAGDADILELEGVEEVGGSSTVAPFEVDACGCCLFLDGGCGSVIIDIVVGLFLVGSSALSSEMSKAVLDIQHIL